MDYESIIPEFHKKSRHLQTLGCSAGFSVFSHKLKNYKKKTFLLIFACFYVIFSKNIRKKERVMKKFFKIGSAVLMVVLLLSLTGCPSPNSPNNPDFDPSVGTWISGVSRFQQSDDYAYVLVLKNSDTYTTFTIHLMDHDKFFVAVAYDRSDVFTSETWLNKVKIDNSSIVIDDPYIIEEYKTSFNILSDYYTKSELLRLLPSSRNWTVHMISDEDATRNIHFVVEKDKAKQILDWVKSK